MVYENNCLLLDITQQNQNQNQNLNLLPGSIGIQCHIFHSDLINEFVIQLSKIPFKFDLFISVPDESTQKNVSENSKK